MLFNYIFLLNNHCVSFANLEIDNDCEVIIPITSESLNEKKKIFEELHASGIRFCFLITKNLTTSVEVSINNMLQFLLAFLFLPNYIKHTGRYLILFERTAEITSHLSDIESDLCREINAQLTRDVIADLLVNNFDLKTPIRNQVCIINDELNNYLQPGSKGVVFETLTTRVLTKSLGKKWLVPVDKVEDLRVIFQSIQHLESWCISTQPLLASLVMRATISELRQSELSIENSVLKTKLQNSYENINTLRENSLWYVYEHERLTQEKKNLQVVSTSNQNLQFEVEKLTNEIKFLQSNRNKVVEWYNKEYEILPRWYKQFGHIIKVILGKRSVKSLFK